jgi:hypothetical protein
MSIEISHRDPKEQSDDELYDILLHIDRHAYPERYQAVRDEYAHRHGEVVNGQRLDDYFDRLRRRRPFAQRSRLKKRILVGLALWGLAMLLVRAVIFVYSKAR